MKQESVPTCVKISAKCQELYYEIVFLVVFLCDFALSFSIDIVYILVIDCDKFLSFTSEYYDQIYVKKNNFILKVILHCVNTTQFAVLTVMSFTMDMSNKSMIFE